MHRELKFRVWSKKLNRYVMEDCDLCNWDHEIGDAPINSYGPGLYDECIIEQYTGLKDRNGIEMGKKSMKVTFLNIHGHVL
jgi:hypothetical protein